jgi:hypothetical protein
MTVEFLTLKTSSFRADPPKREWGRTMRLVPWYVSGLNRKEFSMLPKIASALARVLDPIKPIERPGQSISLTKSSEGGEGGHGPLGYSGGENPPPEDSKTPDRDAAAPFDADAARGEVPLEDVHEDENNPYSEKTRKRGPSLPLQPGLTQVILDLSSKRQEQVAGTASNASGTSHYDSSVKDQKKASRLPKGSMLDKKVG